MKQRWLDVLDKVDALSLRERIFLFLSIFVCVLAVVDFVWLTPALTAYKQLTQRFAAQNTELSRLRDELRMVATPSAAGNSARHDLEQVTSDLAAVRQAIAAALPASGRGVALEQVLAQLLRQQPGLNLLGISTVETATGVGVPATLPAGVQRRGLELRVSGSYAELVRYIKTLEATLPGLRWGTLHLLSEAQPAELRVQLFLLEVQP